jgi:aspartate aminotransferase
MSSAIKTASRLDVVKPSITLAVTAKAGKLKAEGIDVVSFGAGEPDFDTPAHIRDAIRASLDGGKVGKYTEVGGIKPLREAIASTLGKVHGLDLSPDNVLVSCGAKHSLFNLFMALLDPGDEVIIPAPYWVSYPDMVLIAGGKPVFVPTTAETNFTMSAAAFAAAITPRTRAVVLNTPSNPTGAVYSKAQLEAIAQVAVDKQILVISDDIYRELVYGDLQYTSIASLGKEIADLTVLVDGVSKTYAMTGWRIGYTAVTAALAPLVKAMGKMQGQSTSNPTHAAQIGTLAALTGPQACVAEMRTAFDARRIEMVKLLRAIPGVTCREPNGAFYAFPDVSAYIGKKTPAGKVIADDVALCDHLVEAGRVAIVPGSGFGSPGYARLAYACSMEDIRKGIGRIAEAFAALQ